MEKGELLNIRRLIQEKSVKQSGIRIDSALFIGLSVAVQSLNGTENHSGGKPEKI
jgi:hypothetical protein